MADLRIADAPEIDESEVQGGLKIPTGGFGNKAINMNTVASWVVKDKDLPSKGYVDDKFNQGNQGLSGHVANKNNPHEVTKEQVGLGNVDNTADADKPISNATSAALNLKADKTQLQGLATTTQLDLKADKSRVDVIETDLEDSKALFQYDGKYNFDAVYAEKIGGYPLNARLTLSDGSIVQNTVAGNKINPNVDMTGWRRNNQKGAIYFIDAKSHNLVKAPEKKPPYSPEDYQDAYNNGINLAAALKKAYDDGYSKAILDRGEYPFCYNAQQTQDSEINATRSGFNNVASLIRNIQNFTLDFNSSKIHIYYDSDNKSPYDTRTVNTPYNLAGRCFGFRDIKNVTFENGEIKGDQYTRSFRLSAETSMEQTTGIRYALNSDRPKLKNMKIHGFRGDSVTGASRGYTLHSSFDWVAGSINSGGELIESDLDRSSALLSLIGKSIIDNQVQLMTSGYTREPIFGNDRFLISFYRDDDSFITQDYAYPTDNINLPFNCSKVRITVFNTPLSVDVGTVYLVTGSSQFLTISDCDFYNNMRGGVSNVPSNTVIEKCRFFDFGSHADKKYGFKCYSDPTRYAINSEDVYVAGLTVRDCDFKNTEHVIIALCRTIALENNKSSFDAFSSAIYVCQYASIRNNDFGGSGLYVKYTGEILDRVSMITNNRMRDARLDIIAPSINHNVIHSDNVYKRCTISLEGEGIISKGNQYLELPSRYNKVIDVVGVKQFNDFIDPPVNSPQAQGWRSIKISTKNVSEGNGGYISFDNVAANIVRVSKLGAAETLNTPNVHIISPILKNYAFDLNLLSDKTSPDVFNFNATKFTNINLYFGAGSLATQYSDTHINLNDVVFKNSTIQINKNEGASSNTTILIKNGMFDFTAINKFITNTIGTTASIEILFINCTFVSDVQKSFALIQGSTANITSKAIGCRFINVTNSDGITVDENGNVIPSTPPTEPETSPTTH